MRGNVFGPIDPLAAPSGNDRFLRLAAVHRVGARIWIARIILSWGIVSGAMAFILQFASWTGFSPEHTF